MAAANHSVVGPSTTCVPLLGAVGGSSAATSSTASAGLTIWHTSLGNVERTPALCCVKHGQVQSLPPQRAIEAMESLAAESIPAGKAFFLDICPSELHRAALLVDRIRHVETQNYRFGETRIDIVMVVPGGTPDECRMLRGWGAQYIFSDSNDARIARLLRRLANAAVFQTTRRGSQRFRELSHVHVLLPDGSRQRATVVDESLTGIAIGVGDASPYDFEMELDVDVLGAPMRATVIRVSGRDLQAQSTVGLRWGSLE